MQSVLETTDIYRGAYFLSSGGKLSSINVSSKNTKTVVFKITGQNILELDQAYRTGNAKVNPLQLKECLNHLRDLLFKKLREREERDGNNKTRYRGSKKSQ